MHNLRRVKRQPTESTPPNPMLEIWRLVA